VDAAAEDHAAAAAQRLGVAVEAGDGQQVAAVARRAAAAQLAFVKRKRSKQFFTWRVFVD
jgi:hypothetical protein